MTVCSRANQRHLLLLLRMEVKMRRASHILLMVRVPLVLVECHLPGLDIAQAHRTLTRRRRPALFRSHLTVVLHHLLERPPMRHHLSTTEAEVPHLRRILPLHPPSTSRHRRIHQRALDTLLLRHPSRQLHHATAHNLPRLVLLRRGIPPPARRSVLRHQDVSVVFLLLSRALTPTSSPDSPSKPA